LRGVSPDVKIRLMEMERELDRATILRYLEELEGKLAELRRVVEGGPGLEMLRGVRSVRGACAPDRLGLSRDGHPGSAHRTGAGPGADRGLRRPAGDERLQPWAHWDA